MTRHASSYQGYSDRQYESLLAETGFDDVSLLSSLAGSKDATRLDLIAITAKKKTSK